jgi:hypothetical protein
MKGINGLVPSPNTIIDVEEFSDAASSELCFFLFPCVFSSSLARCVCVSLSLQTSFLCIQPTIQSTNQTLHDMIRFYLLTYVLASSSVRYPGRPHRSGLAFVIDSREATSCGPISWALVQLESGISLFSLMVLLWIVLLLPFVDWIASSVSFRLGSSSRYS